MTPHEQRIIRFLSRPHSYPHPVGAILRRETHVSHVFLAGQYAYKLKKPVTFPFLDASTVARRKTFCQLELSLNRRLTSRVYLGIVPIIETPRGLRLGGKGRVIEWLVKMQRLPEERMLDRLVARRTVTRRDIRQIADRLVRFFGHAQRSRRVNWYGYPPQVAELALGNLRECQPFVGTLLPAADRQHLEDAYRQFLTLKEPILERRVREGRVIDGHGDLRCENICLWSPAGRNPERPAKSRWRGVEGTDPVAVFDCVEFQPAFRCGDVANDLAFLIMDLEYRGRSDLARVLVDRYRRSLKDPTFDVVLPFYQCHRSLVRGKVRGLAWLQHPRTRQGRLARKFSQRHFQLAMRYARAFAPPRLIVVCGLIGSGKSTLAKALAQSLGGGLLRTDEIRLREFVRFRRAGQGFAAGLYAQRVSNQVYERLMRRAETIVRAGGSVVCDGTFSKAVGRARLRQIARRAGASFHLFECVVPRIVALRRVARRYAKRTDVSEARPEHYDRLTAGFEPVRGWSPRDWTRLSDNRPAQQTAGAAMAALRRAWQ